MTKHALPTVVFVLLLTACAQAAPTPQPTAQIAPTTAPAGVPTADAFGFTDTTAPAAVPTAEPTADAAEEPVETVMVQRGLIEDVLSLSGQITPARAGLSFTEDGILIKLYVQPGQAVAKGDLVAELDMGELTSQLRQAQVTYEQDQLAIARASQASALEVQQAELDLEAARNDLAKLKAPATAVEIAQAQTDVRLAQTNLDRVRNDASQAKNNAKGKMDAAVIELQALQADYGAAYNELQKRLGTDQERDLRLRVDALASAVRSAEASVFQAQVDYDTARNNEVAAVKEAEALLDLAKAELDALLRGPDQFAIAAQEREVRRAQIAIEQARQRSAPDPSLVRAAKVSRIMIEEIETQIVARRLYAPMSGEVVNVDAAPGDLVSAGSPVVTLLDRARQELIVTAADLLNDGQGNPVRLGVGQPVTVIFDRYGGQRFNGTLTGVPTPSEEQSAVETTYQVSFDGQGQSFELGDEAEISITLSRNDNALWLPLRAVQVGRDRSSVTVSEDGKLRRIDVLTGIVTEDRVEIVAGLDENDVVIIP